MQPKQTSEAAPPASREERFVSYIIQCCQRDKGTAARLRRADNPATEHQCWDILARFGIDLTLDSQRLPFAVMAAAIAKSKFDHNGTLTLGQALLACYDNDRDSDPAQARLRRLLACHDVAELCRILRPLLSLILSKVSAPLDYQRLLRQVLRFAFADQQQAIRTQWAQDFFTQPDSEQEISA